MTIYVRQSQINDPIPSARGVTASVRSVLWGIVTTIAERNGSDEGGMSLDGSLLEREDDFFTSAVALARVQLEEEMKIFQESSMELDDECVMPLAFGKKKKRKSKVEVNLVPGRCPLKSPSGLSYYFHFDGIPDDFVWNVYLPLPAEEYVEENLFGLALPSNAPGVPGVHRYVRIMGCGHSSSSDADAALGTENCITGQALIRSQQTVIVETLGCDQTDGRLEVDRCNLLTVRKSEAQRVKEMLLENLYSTRVEGSTHYDVHEKYWDQRYRLFSLFDMGVRLDAESWYSVTPESIAIHIAEQCQFGCQRTRKLSKSEKKARKRKEEQFPGFIHPPPVTFKCDVVLDLFCGCGGNSIPLASVFHSVVAVDINPEKLADARANSKVYGVDSRIDFVCADAYHVLASLTPGISGIPAPKSKSDEWPPRVDVILLAPPWGGPDYTQKKHFDMSTDFPSGCGLELVRKALLVCENVICVYPRNIKNSQVISMCESVNAKCYVDEVILYKKHKLSVLYFGRMFN